jgi:hypothetical protein
MPERYVSLVRETSEYDSNSGQVHFLYFPIQLRTVKAYNFANGDIVTIQISRILEANEGGSVYGGKYRSYTSGFRVVRGVDKEYDFSVFSYTNTIGGEIFGLRVSEEFKREVGARENDHLDFRLLKLKKKAENEIIDIYSGSERKGDMPFNFKDKEVQEN